MAGDATEPRQPGPDSRKFADQDINMQDAPASDDADETMIDADADADGDVDIDFDGDADADADGDLELTEPTVPDRLDPDIGDHLHNICVTLQDYTEGDRDIGHPFKSIVNRRLYPEYYEVIQEAVAFSTVRGRINKKQYKNVAEYVRDCALIFHNAQVYNRQGSQIFKDAGLLRELFKTELQKLVDQGIIKAEDAVLPDLGELPPPEPTPPPEDDEDVEEDDEEDEDEDEEDDSEDERLRRSSKKRGRPSTRSKAEQGDDDDDAHKKRGRPPKILTPMETRIQSLLKGLRRFKNDEGELRVLHFDKLPDAKANPQYYAAIKDPIALDKIKKRAKRKAYKNVDEVLADLERMFENAKAYNEEDSDVYQDAVELQQQARVLAEQEKKKPDDEFRDEDGKLPLSEVQHKGETWRVGDWVHISNPNDPSKPTVAQIYRIWQDKGDLKWINACWYYQPYQTVHHHEKRFLENEVVKTGQYRDHMVSEIVDRCFVMFHTRYGKGRPKGFPADKQVYVCEARYNEKEAKFNKIKTWTSCLPDEVREKDYEMELFDAPRKLKKVPSPIKHLLQKDAKETDPLPKATYRGNAPPIVGAVHRRPREPNESPPPSPTPEPVPAPIMESAVRRPPVIHTPSRPDPGMYQAPSAMPAQSPSLQYGAKYTPARPMQPSQVPMSPAPGHPSMANQYPGMHSSPVPHPPPPGHAGYQQSLPHYPQQFAPSQPASQYGQHPNPSQYQTQPPPHHQYQQHPPQYASMNPAPQRPQIAMAPVPALHHGVAPQPQPQLHHAPHPSANVYFPPGEPEVYTLPPQYSEVVPRDIKEQFHTDDQGNIIWFTKPPLERKHKGLSVQSAALGHSTRFLADKARDMKKILLEKQALETQTKENAAGMTDSNPMDASSDGAVGQLKSVANGTDSLVVKPTELSKEVLEGLDARAEDFESLERLIRDNCGNYAFEKFLDWAIMMQAGTDTLDANLDGWGQVKTQDRLEKDAAAIQNKSVSYRPKKPWQIRAEREIAEKKRAEEEQKRQLNEKLKVSASWVRYQALKRAELQIRAEAAAQHAD